MTQMNIYFCGAIRGGRDDVLVYQRLISLLKTFGRVLTEHVGDPELSRMGDDGPDDTSIFYRDMAWLEKSDVVIAEVSTPSLGVGFEIGRATAMGKPVLCLYRPRPGWALSAMIAGCKDIQTRAYETPEEAENRIDLFIKSLKRDS